MENRCFASSLLCQLVGEFLPSSVYLCVGVGMCQSIDIGLIFLLDVSVIVAFMAEKSIFLCK